VTEKHTLAHVSADLSGVGSGALRDSALLSGLLIAAAGAAGLSALATPVVQKAPDGSVSAFLLVEHCHLSVHTIPSATIAYVDVMAPDESNALKALEVFVRRLAPAAVTKESRVRGSR
jgi:S-adenosylmethionine/arginine decarboxylase-like enzyme